MKDNSRSRQDHIERGGEPEQLLGGHDTGDAPSPRPAGLGTRNRTGGFALVREYGNDPSRILEALRYVLSTPLGPGRLGLPDEPQR